MSPEFRAVKTRADRDIGYKGGASPVLAAPQHSVAVNLVIVGELGAVLMAFSAFSGHASHSRSKSSRANSAPSVEVQRGNERHFQARGCLPPTLSSLGPDFF